MRQLLVAGALGLVTVGVGISPASAMIQRSTGCVEWNQTDGCVVTQSCSVDTEAHTYSCLSWNSKTHTLTGEGGSY